MSCSGFGACALFAPSCIGTRRGRDDFISSRSGGKSPRPDKRAPLSLTVSSQPGTQIGTQRLSNSSGRNAIKVTPDITRKPHNGLRFKYASGRPGTGLPLFETAPFDRSGTSFARSGEGRRPCR
jgi:hypothetical protein